MEMCYDGALVLPSSYVVMNEEEMTYTEGGEKFYDAVVWCLTQAVAGIIGGASYAAVCWAIGKRAVIKNAVLAAVSSIPWSRVAAVGILAGVVGITAYVISHRN